MSTPQSVAATDPIDPQIEAGRRGGYAALAGLYVISALLYIFLGTRQEVPLLFPDELLYRHAARSVAMGEGLMWRGDSVSLPSTLYVYLLAPAWKLASATSAYGVSKIVSALVMSTVVIPVWLLARSFVGWRLALGAAALSIAGTWMLSSALILSENLALPATTASLAATVMVLRRPGSSWGWWALGFAIVAALARTQLVVMLAVLPLALMADCARAAPDWRGRAREHRVLLAVFGALLVIAATALAMDAAGLVGRYESITGFSPSGDDIANSMGRQWVALVAASGFVPIAALLAIAFSKRAWRDPDAGPLLAVVVPATCVFVAQSGWFLAGAGLTVMVERYVAYVIPISCVLMVVVAMRPDLLWRPGLIIAAAAPLLLLAADESKKPIEEHALFAVTDRMDVFGLGTAGGLAVLAVIAGGLVASVLLLRTKGLLSSRGVAWSVIGITLAILVLQGQSAWNWQLDEARAERAFMPGNLRWVDDSGAPPVARIAVTGFNPQTHHVEFFNNDLRNAFAPPGTRLLGRDYGKVCDWRLAPGGRVSFDPGCGKVGDRYYLDDLGLRLTFRRQRLDARRAGHGRVVTVGGPARLLAGVGLPCDDPVIAADDPTPLCRGPLAVTLFMDAPARLEIAFRGGAVAHTVQVTGKQRVVPPGRLTTFSVPVKRGDQQVTVPVDWNTPVGAPKLVRVDLVRGTRRTSLL